MSHVLVIPAPAKVNLHLSVGARGADGYHEVSTVLQAIGLADEVTLAGAPTLSVTCEPGLGIPASENLAHRAATAFAAACERSPAVAIKVEKRIPAGAGLGGGSSDAAAVIRGLARMWDIPASDPRLRETAVGLGADVPFFLGAPCALMSGRGDTLVRELDAPTFHVVVVWPRTPVPTADAYLAYDAAPAAEPPSPDRLVAALEGGDWRDAATRLHNSMTAASSGLVPVIAEALGVVAAADEIVGASMCGSGSAVFGIAATEAAARSCAEAARERGWWAAVTRSEGGRETVGWNRRRGSRAAAANNDDCEADGPPE